MAVLAPKANFDLVYTDVAPLRVPRVFFFTKNWHWGPKLLLLQNLGGAFVVFFLGGPKSQLRES